VVLMDPHEDPATSSRLLSTRMRWSIVAGLAALVSLLPFVIFGDRVERWLDDTLATTTRRDAVAILVLCALALDTLLPIPSSVLATAAA
jgi:uncharacterized membrane protein YjjP (DUF1212 family)